MILLKLLRLVCRKGGHSIPNMQDHPLSDSHLLARWLENQNEAAFRGLVERYAGLVFVAAQRCSGSDEHAAEAVQLTFITLAKRAKSLGSSESLAGWLHQTAVLQAKNLMRRQQRELRKRQHLHAHMEKHPPQSAPEAWTRMQPVIDDALSSLTHGDREALLLRFYRSLTIREVGVALGIATAAAQKRLDRAMERLRRQLSRRGCEVGGTLATALVVGFGADAKAAVPGISTISTKAAAAATFTSAPITAATLFCLMTKKTTATLAAAVVLAGAGAALLIKNGNSASPGTPPEAASAPGSHTGRFHPTSPDGTPAQEASTRSRPRTASNNPELVSNFGEARVNLSKRVASDMIGMLDDAAKMGELVASGQLGGTFGNSEARVKKALGTVGDRLNLSAAQLEQAGKILADHHRQGVERTRESVAQLRKDPTSLMEMILASDAYLRGEIPEDRYQQIRSNSLGQLGDLMNPLDRENFHGGRPLADQEFIGPFEQLLEPAQREELQSALAEMNEPEGRGRLSELPAMPLEKLSDVISTSRKLTEGHRQMLEGMGALEAMQGENGR